MSMQRGFWFLILLLAVGVLGWIAANRIGSGEITCSKHLAVLQVRLLRSHSHLLRASDDDISSSGLQPRFLGVGVLEFSTSPLLIHSLAPVRASKDLLTLISLRRE
jgi:hypothetical protein